MRVRFERLKKAIVQLIDTDDALGLRDISHDPFKANAEKGRWKFQTTAQQADSFQQWLAAKMELDILSDPEDTTDDWWNKYIEHGYQKGVARAFDDTKKPALASGAEQEAFYAGGKKQFLSDAFNHPVAIEKVKLLAGRVYTELKGVTDAMSQQLGRELTDGLVQGLSPRDIARNMAKRVDNMTKTRAEVIARTEIVRAHAEGQLDSLEAMGVEELGVMAEWSTTKDLKVCKLCAPLQGIVLKIKEARGILPRHPNCRCAFVPANVGEDQSKQKRGPVQITKARNDSIQAENPKSTLEEAKAATSWAGADTKIAPKRPESVLSPSTTKEKELVAKKEAEAKAALAKAEAAEQEALGILEKQRAEAAARAEAAKVQAAKELAEMQAAAAQEKARIEAEARAAEARERGRAAYKREEAGELPLMEELELVRRLPGSTNPELMRNKYTGKQWVMKSPAAGVAPDHLRSEALADELYRTLGARVPRSGIRETAEGPVKLAEFLEGGQTLQQWMQTAPPVSKGKMYAELRKHFVADALLANHDVAGMNFDNIFIVDGKPYRIDNGGALSYRAQGAKKANWGPTVDELRSMRDPKINQQTAAIFGKITDQEINDQIKEILPKKEALMKAAGGHYGIPSTLEGRLKYLEGIIKAAPPPATAQPSGDLARSRKAEAGIGPTTAERVKAARINGVTVKGDRGEIEDNNILMWEEKNVRGEDVVRAFLKVTPEGGKKIQEALADAFAKAGAAASPAMTNTKHPEDVYSEKIIKYAKHVNYHTKPGDYNFNPVLKQEMEVEYQKLFDLYQAENNPAKKAMYKHYKEALEEIHGAMEEQKAVPTIKEYVHTPKKEEEPKVKAGPEGVQVTKITERIQFETADITNGRAKRNGGGNAVYLGYNQEAYQITMPDGTRIQYIPPAATNERGSALAIKGTIQVETPGEANTENLKKAMANLYAIGLDTSVPSPAYEELAYIHRSVYLRNDHKSPDYTAIWNSAEPEEEKLKKLKAWAEKKYKVPLSGPTYNPEGVTKDGFGNGMRYWERWDLPPDKLKQEMAGYVLSHHTGNRGVSVVLDQVLNSGGEMTSTTERFRKGVPLSQTSGAYNSQGSDIETGGASYLFTRIQKGDRPRGHLHFKIERLARQDAVSHADDVFGAVSDYHLGNRAATPEKYKQYGSSSGNETNFKNGLSILDDLDFITVDTKAEADRVKKVFAKHKIKTLADGRDVADIIKVKK